MSLLGRLLALALMVVSPAAMGEPVGKRVDVVALTGGSAPAITVAIQDPVYKKPKRYAGHDLAALLRRAWPEADRWAAEGAELVFHCEDGYSPSMDLARALTGHGVVAARDLDRPANDPWEPFAKGRGTVVPAPFYVVWRDVDPADANFRWPYQLVSLSVETFDRRYGNAAPPAGTAEEARNGFRLFVQNCASCHSVNMVGGDVAPELNVPRNITEYWSAEHLAAFVKEPETYRLRSKMPGFKHLADSERASILTYLAAMRARKICPEGRSC